MKLCRERSESELAPCCTANFNEDEELTMWTLKQLQDPEMPQANINGKWVPARPENYKLITIGERIRHAWAVFIGRAEAFTWPEGQ